MKARFAGARARQGLLVAMAAVLVSPASAMAAEGEAPSTSDEGTLAFSETAAAEAPEGVLDARALPKGTVRLAYRYSRSWLANVYDHHHSLDLATAAAQQTPAFQAVPAKRTLQEHLVSVAYAPWSRLTLVARLPIYLSEQHTDLAAGGSFRNRTEGVGDLEVVALVPFMRKGNESLLFELGFRAPTGKIDEMGTVAGAGGLQRGRLGYPLQPGEGSWALLPGFTYKGHWQSVSWGVQYRGVYWLNENTKGYRPGTRHQVSTWMAFSPVSWLSASGRFLWTRSGNIHGSDPAIGTFPYADPSQDPMRQRRQQLAVGPGINLKLPVPGGPRLGFEALFPIWREIDGPQLAQSWGLHAGIKLDY